MILVTGATGTVGRQVVEQLVAEDQPVRAVARDPDSSGLPDGVEVVAGDLSDAVGLAPNLHGVDAVFLLWPFPTVESVRKLGPALINTLAAHVGRVVYLSATPAAQPPGGFWRAVEALIEVSGLEWTHLRPTGFAKNTLIWADQIRAGDVVRWPYPDAARSLIHERDIAAVAVQALVRDELIGAMPVISGPEAITQADQIAQIGTAIGRELSCEDMPQGEAVAELVARFGNADFARSALDVWAGFVTEPEVVTTAVAEVTGEPGRLFRDWAAEHADDFR
ncbi:NAD(P)H-binding protein [Actinospica sp.]|uniref:NAD(P)H-binding protein n=1 Tax=Actinospica sp. TaxID=1872142 RepID=UPI002C288288|nr:NAD(P)H-binding protein [Actinospica sp.]HWG24177.1 NAD(P)H-binding protein [Actinospica sp.]